jgi:hypothetical protein
MNKAKTVASICFLDNRSISMDVEAVLGIEFGAPMEVGDGQWFCEMIVRSTNGVVALQLLADNPDRFIPSVPPLRASDEE